MTCLAPHPQTETCPDCAPFGPFERNNYYTGKFMGELDFKIETLFHSEKMRHHNRRLHGSGVVCGLNVIQDDNPACRDRFVIIQPGTALDCCGHEIVLKDAETVQLDQLPAIKDLIKKKDADFHRLQICLRFKECPTEQVPILYDDCGCDDTQCAPNRILESFEVGAILDAALDLDHIQAPGLKWDFTAPPAHASQAVIHSASHRMYVITGDDQRSVYALDTENFTVVASHSFATPPLAMAVSLDGKHLFVAIGSKNGLRQLAVLDTDAAHIADEPPSRIQDVPGSDGDDLILSADIKVAGQGLVCLLLQKGELQIWPAEVASDGPNPSPDPASVVLAANLAGLALASDGRTAYTLDATDPTNNLIKAIDLDGKAVTDIKALPANSQPVDLAVIASSGADQIAVVSNVMPGMPGMLYLVDLSSSSPPSSRQLDHPAKAVAVSPGGTWAYVLEEDTDSFIQPVNLPNIKPEPAHSLGAAVKVGAHSTQVLVNESGRRLFVPFIADATVPNQGGVAVIEIDETDCADIFWKSLDGCPVCDTEDCVVLATIENYQPGFQLLDQVDPPFTAADKGASIARIDNRRGRKLLPSTEALAEAIECLLTRQAGVGQQGQQGLPGPEGPPGQSFGNVLPHICAINWPHEGTITINSNDQGWVHLNRDGLLIAFDRPILAETLTPRTLQVLYRPLSNTVKQGRNPFLMNCYCEILGTVTGVLSDLGEPCLEAIDNPGNTDTNVTSVKDKSVILARFRPGPRPFRWVPGEYRVILEGDQVLGTNKITIPGHGSVNPGVDADHMGPGLPDPLWITTNPRTNVRMLTGDGIEGGTFVSWFQIVEQ